MQFSFFFFFKPVGGSVNILCHHVVGFTLFEPVHLLWINLYNRLFPALALGLEKGDPDIISASPVIPRRNIRRRNGY